MVSHQSKAFQKVLSRQRSPPASLSWVRWPMEISFARHQFPADIRPSPLWSHTTLSRWMTPLVSAHTHHAFLAAAAQLGNRTAAGARAREVLQREPAFTAQAVVGTLHYRNPTDGEHVREGLMKAGLPD
jgi:hypothetical protein